MDQRIIDLYDEYTHRPLPRQEFIKRLALLAGSMGGAMALLPLLEVNEARAAVTGTDELFTERIRYAGVNGEMQAYVARPETQQRYPAVIVIHENRGLNAHIEDVSRRVARAGYLAIAPNALAPLGGTPEKADDARALFLQLKADDNLQNFIRAYEYLPSRTDHNGSTGCVGFCWGGAMANNLAVALPGLKAAVAFYGRQPRTEDVMKIRAAVQLHYAEMDQGVNAGIEAYESALKAAGIRFERYLYEGAQHAFHNDTAPTRYNKAAARLAWQRTLDFFGKYLS